ncbi:MAG: ABC transporter ATP-binding protein [Bdellovibrionales bacterium]|nr:ABC transporter ATP-binding protein [Bdellovibrionales bacterium]
MKNQSPVTQPVIQVRDVYFDYSTPVKVPWIKGLPFKRVIQQKHTALKGISLDIQPGKITALLGRNGSGKTTLIKVMTGARFPSSGTVSLFGNDPQAVRHRIGLCLGGSLVYHRLTGRENLEYFGKLYGVPNLDRRIYQLAELLRLEKNLDQLVESYSFGMKVKLALARSMIHSPELLILDEPTLGIDLQLATQIRDFVKNLNCSVLLTTHYMEEAELLAEDVCIIDHGKILASGTKENVLRKFKVQTIPQVFSMVVNRTPALEGHA